MNKNELLQLQARKILKYLLEKCPTDQSRMTYTHDELSLKLGVDRSLVTHMVNGNRSIDLQNIEELEGISGIEILKVVNPEKLRKIEIQPFNKIKVVTNQGDSSQMENNLKLLNFYPKLLTAIKSKINEDFPEVLVKDRYSSQYGSVNIFGKLVTEKLEKNNLHLLFFRYSEIKGEKYLKIEMMIANELLRKSLHNIQGVEHLPKSDPNFRLNTSIPVFKVKDLSTSEIGSIANLSLAIFKIKCGLTVEKK